MINIRLLSEIDSYDELTGLLHRAYAPLADAGMHFVASHQPPETTKERCEGGTTFVAELNGRLVGTITLYPPHSESTCLYYRNPSTFHFGQFAVHPDQQGIGLGRRLLSQVEEAARSQGAKSLALDTSERATDLIALYTHLGFHEIDRVSWGDIVNYNSVILSKSLR